MKDCCILHVGPAKTGSSSIQQTLFTELNDPAFEYADLGVPNHNLPLFTIFSRKPEEFSGNSERGFGLERVEALRNKLKRQFRLAILEARAPNVIMSGESIASLRTGELTAMRRRLEKHFRRVKVVAYARPPRALMNSAFQQRIKSRLPDFNVRKLYPHYRSKFERLDKVFGRENVELWRYATDDFPQGDVVRHFFQMLGIAEPARFHRVNESLSKPAVQALFAYHKYCDGLDAAPSVPMIRKLTVSALSELPGGKFRLASSLLDPVITENHEDIAWVEDRLGVSLAEARVEDSDGVAGEADMLAFTPEMIAGLEDLVRARTALPGRIEGTERYVASLVETLIGAIAAERSEQRRQQRIAKGAEERENRKLGQAKRASAID